MLCRLGKSLFLIFYFAENRKDDFSLRYVKFGDKIFSEYCFVYTEKWLLGT